MIKSSFILIHVTGSNSQVTSSELNRFEFAISYPVVYHVYLLLLLNCMILFLAGVILKIRIENVTICTEFWPLKKFEAVKHPWQVKVHALYNVKNVTGLLSFMNIYILFIGCHYGPILLCDDWNKIKTIGADTKLESW